MTRVVYRPKRGGRFVAPHLKPGTELRVSHREAEHLVSTGAFQYVDTKLAAKPASEPAPAETSKGKAAKGARKETR